VESIVNRSTYPNYEIVCVADHHADESALADLLRAGGERLRMVPYPHRFDFSRKINTGVLASRGEFVVLLNDDTEVITPEWIEQLLLYAQQDGVGAVGARLLFGDGRIQHAGIAAIWGRAGHSYYGFPGDHPGYFDNALVPINQLAVTAACLMTRRSSFEEVGGLSLEFPLNYNDVDLCLKLRRAGYRIVCTPDAELWHLEAATRRTGTVDKFELDTLHSRWGHVLNHDPYYSPYFPPWSADYITPVYLCDGTPMPPPEPTGLYWMRDALKPA
jgi:GT2 family glycosyltransferase